MVGSHYGKKIFIFDLKNRQKTQRFLKEIRTLTQFNLLVIFSIKKNKTKIRK